jgi:hypothetical protein
MSYSIGVTAPNKAAAIAEITRAFDTEVMTGYPEHAVDRDSVLTNATNAVNQLTNDAAVGQSVTITLSGSLDMVFDGNGKTNVVQACHISATAWIRPVYF